MTTPPHRPTVLVVDDAGEVVVLCVNMLQSLGYAVKGVPRAEAALELVRREPFDVMIVDYRMPGRDGFAVFREARVLRPRMGFVLLTGHGTADVVEEAAALGFHAVLLKPFTRAQLRDAVERALSARG